MSVRSEGLFSVEDETWLRDSDLNDLTWMASTFTGDQTFFDDHDLTFAPPNSPLGDVPTERDTEEISTESGGRVPSARILCRNVVKTKPVPVLRFRKLHGTYEERNRNGDGSPVVCGMLDNTWYVEGAEGVETPKQIPVSKGSISVIADSLEAYPSFPLSHDLTFRDRDLSGSLNSNQFLNESNLDLLHTSLVESAKKRKRANLSTPEKPSDSPDTVPRPWSAFGPQQQYDFDNTSKNCKILEPIIKMFLKTKAGDSNQPHILTCIRELLASTVISAKDLCNDDFLSKSAEMMSLASKCDEDTLFHLIILFEKHLLAGSPDAESLRLMSNKCRKPLGKLAMAGHEELSTRAEECLLLMGDDY